MNEKVDNAGRLKHIASILAKHGFGYFLERVELASTMPLKERLFKKEIHKSSLPKRVRLTLEQLGPTFVKFGQMLSTRPDVVPPKFSKELAKLQDHVKPFSYHIVEARIKHEFNKPLKKIFKTFEKEPIASASLGQVHKATLKNGEKVVVKILRPNIKKTLKEDIVILHYLAERFEKHFPNARFYNAKGFIQEFEKQLKKELDYKNEGRNIDRFRKNFADDPSIVVPKVYWKHSSSSVLTMEYIDGVKITDLTGKKKKLGRYNKKAIAVHFMQSIFKQIFEHRFFHADPHPGNVMVLSKSKLAYLDFGMMQEIDEDFDQYLENTFIALLQKDAKALTSEIIRFDAADEPYDEKELLSDVERLMEEYVDKELGDINLAHAVNQLTKLDIKYKAQIPKEFFMLGKSLATVQGVCAELDPSFNVGNALEPVMEQLIKKRLDPKYIKHRVARSLTKIWRSARDVPRRLDKVLRRAEQGDLTVELRHRDLEEFELEMDRSSNRIALGYVTGAFIIASAVVMSLDLGPKIYGISSIAFFGLLVSGVLGFWLAVSILQSGRL